MFYRELRFTVILLSCLQLADNVRETDREDLMSELEVMKKLKPHPHVIKLMGCVTESGNNIYIIM